MPDQVPGPMGVTFPTSMPTPAEGLVGGISQGVQLGNHFAQIALAASQKRAQDYDLAANKAKLGMQLMGDPNQAMKVRLNAANNLVAPFFNDHRWGFQQKGDGEAQQSLSFTPEDLQKPALDKWVSDSEGILKNPEIPMQSKIGLLSARSAEYFAEKGNDAAAAEMMQKSVMPLGYSKTTSPDTGRTFLASDIPGVSPVNIPDPTIQSQAPSPTPGKTSRAPGDNGIYTPQDAQNPALVNPKQVKDYQNVIDGATKAITEDPNIKSYQEQLASYGPIRSMLHSGNPAATGILRAQITRNLAGLVGKLSDFEVKQNGGDPSALAKAKRTATMVLTGKLPDSDVADFTQMLNVAEQNAKNGLQRKAGAITDAYYKRLPPRYSRDLFNQQTMTTISSSAPTSAAPSGPPKSTGDPKADAYLGVGK